MASNSVVLMKPTGEVLANPDGTVKTAVLDSEGQVPPGCCCQTCCITKRAGSWPATMTLTITSPDACACLAQEITANYTLFGYGGQMPMCDGSTIGYSITCSNNNWIFSQNACRCPGNFGQWPGIVLSCNPLHLIFPNMQRCAFGGNPQCCDGYMTIEVTE